MTPKLPVVALSLLLLACSNPSSESSGKGGDTAGKPAEPAPAKPSDTAPAKPPEAAPPAAPQPAADDAWASDNPQPTDFQKVSDELEKKCTPKTIGDSNMEMKMGMQERVECTRKQMIKELDKVLLPLKTADKARFDALMKQQADFNKYATTLCLLVEEQSWLNLEEGVRYDGTARSMPHMSCQSVAFSDRTFFARTVQAHNPDALAKRIEGRQADGEKARKSLEALKAAAEKFTKTPAKAPEGSMAYVLTADDWKKQSAEADAMNAAAAALGRSTCEVWPALAKRLGGIEGCSSQAAGYYIAMDHGHGLGE